jgi:uncharacterized RDD family membrane protein YckC
MAYQGTPAYSGAPSGVYSDWLTRVGALLIDRAPVIGGLIVVLILEAIVGNTAFAIVLWFLYLLSAIGWDVYNRWIMGGQGQSLGKRVLNIRLVSEDTGQPIGTLNAFLRDIVHIVDGLLCGLGYLFPLWDPKRQTFADKIMKTVVIPE